MENEQDRKSAADKLQIPEKWSSLDEIAEHLGISTDTIRIWIKKDTIPYYRVGRQFKFRISQIDEWVISRKSAEID
jgi:excisionase family DNA binding protein